MFPDIAFYIYLESDGIAFPDNTWLEDGRCTLSIWASEINNAMNNEKMGVFTFIECPFFLRFQINDQDIEIRYQDGTLYCVDSLANFQSELRETIDATNNDLARLSLLTGTSIQLIEAQSNSPQATER